MRKVEITESVLEPNTLEFKVLETKNNKVYFTAIERDGDEYSYQKIWWGDFKDLIFVVLRWDHEEHVSLISVIREWLSSDLSKESLLKAIQEFRG